MEGEQEEGREESWGQRCRYGETGGQERDAKHMRRSVGGGSKGESEVRREDNLRERGDS